VSPGKFFPALHKQFSCAALFSNRFSDGAALQWPPPRAPPPALERFFLQAGAVRLSNMYFAQNYAGAGDPATTSGSGGGGVWRVSTVERFRARLRVDDFSEGSSYSAEETRKFFIYLRKHAGLFKGGHVFVLGSEQPWIEACLLEVGARLVTTIEYGRIVSEHPQIQTMTPPEVTDQFLKGALPQFDAGVTFSSLEHSGLGRYGDLLNPWGDIQAMARAWCMTRAGGALLVGQMEQQVHVCT
jgi:hypothetical protein